MSGRIFAIRLKLLTRLYLGDGQKVDILSHFFQFFDVGTAEGTSLEHKTPAGLADSVVFFTPESRMKKLKNSQFSEVKIGSFCNVLLCKTFLLFPTLFRVPSYSMNMEKKKMTDPLFSLFL